LPYRCYWPALPDRAAGDSERELLQPVAGALAKSLHAIHIQKPMCRLFLEMPQATSSVNWPGRLSLTFKHALRLASHWKNRRVNSFDSFPAGTPPPCWDVVSP